MNKFEGKRAGLRMLASGGALMGMCLVLLAGPGSAAASVECDGSVAADPPSSKKNYIYEFTCEAAPVGTADKIDSYSLISTKRVLGFETEVVVLDPVGEVVPTEAFGCEGPIPSFGFGCNGGANGAALGNTPTGGLSLAENPCSRRARKNRWRMWLVVAADKINPATSARTPTSSEPFPVSVPKCPPLNRR